MIGFTSSTTTVTPRTASVLAMSSPIPEAPNSCTMTKSPWQVMWQHVPPVISTTWSPQSNFLGAKKMFPPFRYSVDSHLTSPDFHMKVRSRQRNWEAKLAYRKQRPQRNRLWIIVLRARRGYGLETCRKREWRRRRKDLVGVVRLNFVRAQVTHWGLFEWKLLRRCRYRYCQISEKARPDPQWPLWTV